MRMYYLYMYPHNTLIIHIKSLCIICGIGVCAYIHSDFMISSCIKLFIYKNAKDTFHHFKNTFFYYEKKSNLKSIFGGTLGSEQSHIFH